MGPTILFTHLKIILLQCFQFSVFSFQFSATISSIQTDPKSLIPKSTIKTATSFFLYLSMRYPAHSKLLLHYTLVLSLKRQVVNLMRDATKTHSGSLSLQHLYFRNYILKLIEHETLIKSFFFFLSFFVFERLRYGILVKCFGVAWVILLVF